MAPSRMTHRERLSTAIAHQQPDRIPRDFAAKSEVWTALKQRFSLKANDEVLRLFDTDCRVISYDSEAFFHGSSVTASAHPIAHDDKSSLFPLERASRTNESGAPAISVTDQARQHTSSAADAPRLPLTEWKKSIAPDINMDLWGARRQIIANQFGSYEELCEYPLGAAESAADVNRHPWPQPDWWDFSRLPAAIEKINPNREYHLRYRVGSIFETAWSLRGFEQFLADLILQPDIAHAILGRITEIHLENLRRVMALAADKIDMIYTFDDMAHQQAPLFSPDLWRSTLGVYQKKLFEQAKVYGKPLMLHSCGAIYPLIGNLIDIGLDVLNPIQPNAAGMDMTRLKKEFGHHLSFHGGIDIQDLLPNATPVEVTAEAQRISAILGEQGGYILSPAHHVQPDTPLENILAIYGIHS